MNAQLETVGYQSEMMSHSLVMVIKSDPNKKRVGRCPHFLKLISVQCVIRPCRATFPPQINSRACTANRHYIVIDSDRGDEGDDAS